MSTRPAWVTAATDTVARVLTGAHRAGIRCWHAGGTYMRTCPVTGCRWHWRALGYTTWGVAAAAPLTVGGALLAAAGPLTWGIAGATAVTVCWIAGKDDEEAKEDDDPEPEQPPIDPLLELTAHLIGDARGVHLSALLAALHQAGADPRYGAPDLRADLTARGVAQRPSVRAPKGGVPGAPVGVAQGVHREDLEAVIGPLPAPSPEPLSDPVATATTGALTCDVAGAATAVATSRSHT